MQTNGLSDTSVGLIASCPVWPWQKVVPTGAETWNHRHCPGMQEVLAAPENRSVGHVLLPRAAETQMRRKDNFVFESYRNYVADSRPSPCLLS